MIKKLIRKVNAFFAYREIRRMHEQCDRLMEGVWYTPPINFYDGYSSVEYSLDE